MDFDASWLIGLNAEPLEPEAYEARLRELQDRIVDALMRNKNPMKVSTITTGENGLLHTLLRVKDLSHEKAIDFYMEELRANTYAFDKKPKGGYVFSEANKIFFRNKMQDRITSRLVKIKEAIEDEEVERRVQRKKIRQKVTAAIKQRDADEAAAAVTAAALDEERITQREYDKRELNAKIIELNAKVSTLEREGIGSKEAYRKWGDAVNALTRAEVQLEQLEAKYKRQLKF